LKNETIDIPGIAWFFIVIGSITLIIALLSPIILAPLLVKIYPEVSWIADTQVKTSAPSIGELGTAGDFLGGSTVPFLTIASVFFLISTIFIQRRELKLQHEELTETKNIFKYQSFENTFFNMLNLHNQIVQSINYIDTETQMNDEHNGRYFFQTARNQLKLNFINVIRYQIDDENSGKFPTEGYFELKEIISTYEPFYRKHQALIGHYFRNLYHTVKLVHDNTDLKEYKDKMKYMRIIRAQLSSYELVLLLYNALFNANYWNEKDFLDFINKYDLLQNLEKELLIRPEHFNLLKYYDVLRPLTTEEIGKEL
jgi:hypothetical protein